MPAQWLDLGANRWWLSLTDYSAGINNWRMNPDPDNAYHYMRFGNEAQLFAAQGKTLRAFRIKHQHYEGGTRNSTNVAGLFLGVGAFPQPEYTFPNSLEGGFVTREVKHEDNTRPIGRFSTNAGDYFRGSDNWPGLFTLNPTQALRDTAGGGIAPIFRVQEFKVLVDDRPKWTMAVPSAVLEGGRVNITLTLKWPDGTPIEGEQIRLLAGVRTQVRNLQSNPADVNSGWGANAQRGTAANGSVVFQIRGNIAGSDVLKVYMPETHRAGLYDPYFEKDFDFYVASPVQQEPPPPVCVDYPEQQHVPAVPPRVEVTPVFAWDSGAISYKIMLGNAELAFSRMEKVVGAAIGIMPDPGDEPVNHGNYKRITHGFIFDTSTAGQRRAQIVESGKRRTVAFAYTADTIFRIQRAGTTVTYIVDGTRVYTSRVASAGAIVTASSIYATGDRVP